MNLDIVFIVHTITDGQQLPLSADENSFWV